ncbi:topoisomerase DNA-binding C4 zinc finger domain-containing protein [Acerihabitans sp. KWT182]|uniref:Topoisomerase DNA-binding C4 zinc finger domain-containing protein n=1 Tax=Acerihabitans sp. KWT182 TaxID=3157919 RepID=A0AAU7Q904_9GAMM
MAKAALFNARPIERCPDCGAALVIRSGQHGPFLGCSQYPHCAYIKPLKQHADGHIVTVLEGQSCPACQAKLVLRQGRYGMFIGCSNYPACQYIAAADKPDETAIACPLCGIGKLLQRTSRFGKTFYACDEYPKCRFAINFKPVTGECAYCHFPLLMEKNTLRGAILYCADKRCGKPVTVKEHDEQ